ncbi:hypothetical protein [Methylobacterium sp. NEAU K]|uniref:hypothetical protein n=1 Tax=Methylobacterium sp. NEAU K TaxID=3064946 RepID=UPI002737766E|nr:hypothetical protein [Methylobacterium sp. NEAU K]MDP4006712.1 hypothetical protein [Methylobacterium sp. NEAU K]
MPRDEQLKSDVRQKAMPEIKRQYIDSVLTLSDSNRQPSGTAFIVEYTQRFGEPRHYYLSTCDHNTNQAITIFSGDQEIQEFHPEEWHRPTGCDDIAIIDVTENHSFPRHLSHMSFNIGESVDRTRGFYDIGVDLYMLGLLVDDNDPSNYLIRARFGNLSAFADDRFVMEMGNKKKCPCHLADMRSRGGFSGSPVIAYYEIPALDGHVIQKSSLLGIHSAQHKEPVKTEEDGYVTVISLPSSVSRIVPAWSIKDLIVSNEKLADLRMERILADSKSKNQ